MSKASDRLMELIAKRNTDSGLTDAEKKELEEVRNQVTEHEIRAANFRQTRRQITNSQPEP